MSKPFCCPPADPIILDPIVIVENHFHPQLVPVIQPIQVVHNHHCVPIYKKLYSCSSEERPVQVCSVKQTRPVKKRVKK